MTIEVVIRHKDSQVELAHIEIENVGGGMQPTDKPDELEEFGDYSVRFGVHKGRGTGFHQRGIHSFPRKRYNVLALLLQALNTLDPSELEYVGDWDKRAPIKDLPTLPKKRGFW